MNKINCAQCGKELSIIRKAIPIQHTVINVVEPHTCGELTITEKLKADNSSELGAVEKAFSKFEFVKTLNDLAKKPILLPHTKMPQDEQRQGMKETHEENYGDKRDPKHQRKEKTSIAPNTLLDQIMKRKLPTSTPERDTDVEPND